MMDQLPAAFGFSILYVLSFAAARIVRKRFPASPELSRKTVHVLSGLISLPVPFFITGWILPALCCSATLLVLLITRLTGRLEEVHQVGRRSLGAFLFPMAIFLLFLLEHGRPVFYAIGILVLTLSDSAAAIVGRRCGSTRFTFWGKSLEGSLAFFIVSWFVVQSALFLSLGLPGLQAMEIGFVVAVVMTGLELVTPWGTDNLVLPLGSCFLAERMSRYPAMANDQLILYILLAAVCAVCILVLLSARVSEEDFS
jgi:dolichol kinase